jgi:hypothetical protein
MNLQASREESAVVSSAYLTTRVGVAHITRIGHGVGKFPRINRIESESERGEEKREVNMRVKWRRRRGSVGGKKKKAGKDKERKKGLALFWFVMSTACANPLGASAVRQAWLGLVRPGPG